MKKIVLGVVLLASVVGCRASVHVQASTPAPPPPAAEPAPPPPAEPAPKVGDAIELPAQIEFERDQARIKQTPDTLATLEKLADIMKKNPGITKLRIEGHTDATGKAKHNEKLSKQRAEAVAKWLGDHEVKADRLTTVGYGASRPIAPNDTAEHRAQNRRTEYYVEEIDGKKLDQPTQKVAGGAPTSGKTSN
jgi:OOP family OmpA-OmpF porin